MGENSLIRGVGLFVRGLVDAVTCEWGIQVKNS